eukprot:1306297-Rhodomonas_salina.1
MPPTPHTTHAQHTVFHPHTRHSQQEQKQVRTEPFLRVRPQANNDMRRARGQEGGERQGSRS